MFPSSASTSMDTPFFYELRKQASFFLKEKLRTARLALTDVTPAQLLAEEATSASTSAPDAKTMRCISRAAFEVDDYWRIVEILHQKFEKFERKQWREAYNALILLEYLLTHGPQSIAEQFQLDKHIIEQLGNVEFVDERGFNWGLTVRGKTQRVLKLLENRQHLKEERELAMKITFGIQGFGSSDLTSSSSSSSPPPSSPSSPSSSPPSSPSFSTSSSISDHELVLKNNYGIRRRRSSGERDDVLLANSEKENSKCDAAKTPQTRRKGRAEERVLQELSSNKMLAVDESKPLLAH
ncbi:epsin-3-like [Canna indica]|uniref:Epsin-3-like n=1 Tax=Canna indica TaxID=4628 RepID=A0AAQ3KNM8_9LILI|nr:epsin-3-like [Canna indica]